MIVLARNFGQLGNRLWLSAHLIAAARECGTELLNPSFAEYACYFTSTARDVWCRYPTRPCSLDAAAPSDLRRKLVYQSVYLSTRTLAHLRLTRFPIHLIRLGKDQTCDLDSEQFRRRATSFRPLFVSGWGFRSRRLVNKHFAAIRDHFEIIPEHRKRVDQLVGELRSDAEVVIGVHIRHGDYARWQGGKYFYPISKYVAIMRKIRQQLGDRPHRFLVCGNGDLNQSDFADLNVRFGTGHLIEDMYSFAETDFLIGPPSTYTKWASFYGKVPLEFIESADHEPCLKSISRRRLDIAPLAMAPL